MAKLKEQDDDPAALAEETLPFLKTLLHLHDLGFAPSMQVDDRKMLLEIIAWNEDVVLGKRN